MAVQVPRFHVQKIESNNFFKNENSHHLMLQVFVRWSETGSFIRRFTHWTRLEELLDQQSPRSFLILKIGIILTTLQTADLAVGPLGLIPSRQVYLDFTYPFGIGNLRLLTASPDRSLNFESPWKPFSQNVNECNTQILNCLTKIELARFGSRLSFLCWSSRLHCTTRGVWKKAIVVLIDLLIPSSKYF